MFGIRTPTELIKFMYLVSQLMKSDGWNVDTVDNDGSFSCFHDPEKSEHQRRFTGAGSTDDSNFFAASDFEGNAFKDQVKGLSVK